MGISTYHAVPERSKPTFVAAIGGAWKGRSLPAIEVGWRWAVGLPLLGLAWRASGAVRGQLPGVAKVLEGMSISQPVEAVRAMENVWGSLRPGLERLWWLLPVAVVCWSLAAGWGRTAVWRRVDPRLTAKPWTLAGLAGIRTVLLLGILAVWVWSLGFAADAGVTGPAARGQEPDVVLFFALTILATLGLFVVWTLLSWVPEAAGPLAMERGDGLGAALRRAAGLRGMRARLIETNLVMGIVRVALIVLAMVFSACPLPFESVESPAFLTAWWSGVALLFVLASDFFKVVRSMAYISLVVGHSQQPEQAARR